jgi:hypothetical protein
MPPQLQPPTHHTQPADTIEAGDRQSAESRRQFEQMLIEEHP